MASSQNQVATSSPARRRLRPSAGGTRARGGSCLDLREHVQPLVARLGRCSGSRRCAPPRRSRPAPWPGDRGASERHDGRPNRNGRRTASRTAQAGGSGSGVASAEVPSERSRRAGASPAPAPSPGGFDRDPSKCELERAEQVPAMASYQLASFKWSWTCVGGLASVSRICRTASTSSR